MSLYLSYRINNKISLKSEMFHIYKNKGKEIELIKPHPS